jgi:hypothetical protein
MVRGDHAALLFRRYLLPVPPAAPLEPLEPDALPDAPPEAPLEALPDCWRSLLIVLEPLALPEPLRPPLALLPERAPLSLLPLLAFRPWLSPHAERANAIAAAITPIESLFMISPSTSQVEPPGRSPDDCPPGKPPARRDSLLQSSCLAQPSLPCGDGAFPAVNLPAPILRTVARRQRTREADRDGDHGVFDFPATACNSYVASLSSGADTWTRRSMMNEPVNDCSSSDLSWEIYEIGEPQPYAWSWRCRSHDRIVRRGAIMYSSIHGAIEDAVKHGMEEPASAIRP